ncbi:hypothetical protein KCU62_g7807, partial [Aureobasidium sp. EXF-3399]
MPNEAVSYLVRRPASLSSHIHPIKNLQITSILARMWRCRMCQQNGKHTDCRTKGNLMAHLGSAHNMGPFRCALCPYAKCRADHVQAHINKEKLMRNGRHEYAIVQYSQRMNSALYTESNLSYIPPYVPPVFMPVTAPAMAAPLAAPATPSSTISGTDSDIISSHDATPDPSPSPTPSISSLDDNNPEDAHEDDEMSDAAPVFTTPTQRIEVPAQSVEFQDQLRTQRVSFQDQINNQAM